MKIKVTTFILGIVVFLAVIVGVLSLNGQIFAFVDIFTFLFVAGIAVGLGLAGYKGDGWLGYIQACKKHFITGGIVGTLIGSILTLANAKDFFVIRQGLAIALLSILYGVVLYCIADALVTKTKQTNAL